MHVPRPCDVPGELLGRSKQRVNFRLTGRGRYSYQCIMEGFVAADRLMSTTKDWRVQRFYEAAPLERDGKPVNRGFDVLQGSYTSFRNELNELPVGRRGHVTLNVWRPGVGSNVSPDQLEYLVVTEPLPSGVSVIEDSVSGGFERFEITPGAITFFIGNRRGIWHDLVRRARISSRPVPSCPDGHPRRLSVGSVRGARSKDCQSVAAGRAEFGRVPPFAA